MVKLQIESMDLKEEAFSPLVSLITSKVGEAFELHNTREELPRYMTKKQAAIYVGCSFNTLQKFIRSGLKVITVNNVVRIDKKDVDSFLEKNKK